MENTDATELGALLREILSMGLVCRQEESPRITEISTTPHEDGVIYDGKIVISNTDKSQRDAIEKIFHQLKHCFIGDYVRKDGTKRVPDWMVEEFRAYTAKHSRVSVAYTLTFRESDGSLIINFHRSMAKEASGAHQLCKITPENSDLNYPITRYHDQNYYAIPLNNKEANRLMELFASMASDAITTNIFEQEIRRTATEDAQTAEEEAVEPQVALGAVVPVLG